MRRVLRVLQAWATGAVFALVVAAAGPAPALEFVDFGHFNQNDSAFKDVCGGTSACGPIATLNSFVFLQKKYPKIYGDKLVGKDPVAAAKAISDAMGCKACGGTDTTKFYAGKQAYIEARVPGKTAYARRVNPKVEFLTGEMKHGEDVELFISYFKDGVFDSGHYVTLYDITDSMISFVDPGGAVDGGMNGAVDEKLEYTFDKALKTIVLKGYGGTPAGMMARVEFAFSESPIPEPGTWLLLIVGAGASGVALRRRQAAAAA